MKFIDLQTQQQRIRKDIESRMLAVLDHGQYILGPEVKALEVSLADYVGVKHCIAVSSGTDALLIALMAYGVRAGDEVITTPFSFIATAEVIALLGAVPVFVDIEADSYNINPDLIEAAITPQTKAIMPVNLYGQCADYDRILPIAKRHNIPVIEDAAQSFGATWNGKKSCGLTDIGCTSFFLLSRLVGMVMVVHALLMMMSWQLLCGKFLYMAKIGDIIMPEWALMGVSIPYRLLFCSLN